MSETYLFETHSKEELVRWAASLRYFYFLRAWGGHANDGNEFKAGIVFNGREDLVSKLQQLGLTVGTISPDDPQPVTGHAYSYAEYSAFKRAIKAFPDLEHPGRTTVQGMRVFIWVEEGMIAFTRAGLAGDNQYDVSEGDFQACLQLELLFDQLGWECFKDSRKEDSAQCFSAKKYGVFFRH